MFMKTPKNWKPDNLIHNWVIRESDRQYREGILIEEVPMLLPYQHGQVPQEITPVSDHKIYIDTVFNNLVRLTKHLHVMALY